MSNLDRLNGEGGYLINYSQKLKWHSSKNFSDNAAQQLISDIYLTPRVGS